MTQMRKVCTDGDVALAPEHRVLIHGSAAVQRSVPEAS